MHQPAHKSPVGEGNPADPPIDDPIPIGREATPADLSNDEPIPIEGEANHADLSTDDSIPIGDLILLSGTVEGHESCMLKDDGCSTNIISKDLVRRNPDTFDIVDANITISHSKKGTTEKSVQMARSATIRVGSTTYTGNWAIADCRYDVLLGMPWHEHFSPKVDYTDRTVMVDGKPLPIMESNGHKRKPTVEITNIGVKKFRSLLRKKGHRSDFEVFQVCEAHHLTAEKISKMGGDRDKKMEELLKKYEKVFVDELPGGLPPKRDVDHAIETNPDARPPHRPLYQLSPSELIAAKAYIVELLRKGKIRRSRSPYGAPLFFVRHNNQLRAVVDYRALNQITKKNSAPLPRPDEMFDRLGDAKFFSKLDLKVGFHQIRVKPEDIEKTAFKTKYGHFEYLVMPMGLCNAPATFQALMNRLFYDCIDIFLVVYMDDLLIFSNTREDHLRHVEVVLSRLKKEKLYVAPKKCSFMEEETEFLGMIVGRNGLRVNPAKIAVIQTWPRPTTLTELRSFIGLLQFFRRFIKDFSKIASPLTALTRKRSGIHKWNDTCTNAFRTLKKALVTAPVLVSPDWSKPFRCHVDASQEAVGGTLTQLDTEGSERVVAYYSRKLSDSEQDCTANERELLGLVYNLKRFRCYLEGASFDIFTDNQVLQAFLEKKNISRKEARWLDLLGQFGISKPTLVSGKVHVLGDALSRAPHVLSGSFELNNISVSRVALDFNFDKLYDTDQFFKPIFRALHGELPTDSKERDRVCRVKKLFSLNDGLLLYKNKVCVPRSHVRDLLHLAHDSKVSGHFAFAKTLARLDGFHWKGKTRDVKKYCAGCLICQQNKDGNQKKITDPQPLEIPQRRWGSVSSDFIVSLPRTSRGFDAITTYVDRLSRRVHFLPCKSDDTALDVAKSFFDNIFKLHGLPDELVSDRDPKFTSNFWKNLMKLCGIKTKMSTSHHPQTDGISEVMNRMVGNYLRCYCSLNQKDWDELLPAAEFAYNSAESTDLGCSPFEVDLGWKPKGPLDLLSHSTESPLEALNDFKKRLAAGLEDAKFSHAFAKARQAAYSAAKFKPPAYVVGDLVWLDKDLFKDAIARQQKSKKLSARRFGPFKIMELIGKNAVRLELPNSVKIHPVVHVEHTVPHRVQPAGIAQESQPKPAPVTGEDGDLEFEVGSILSHRKRGRGFQFLTLMKGAPRHEAAWQPTGDFVDRDGTVTKVFLDYIVEHGILTHLH